MHKILLASMLLLAILATGESRKYKCAEYTDADADILFDHTKGKEKAEWKRLNEKHGRKFASEQAEEAHRRNSYRKAAKEITKINKKHGGKVCLRLNKFAMMDKEEFKDFLGGPELGTKHNKSSDSVARGSSHHISKRSVPMSLFHPSGDVGYQGDCGSCVLWSSLHVLNGLLIKAHSKTIELSEKQLVDCYNYVDGSNYDCVGFGDLSPAFEHFMSHLPVEKHAYKENDGWTGECDVMTSGQFVANYEQYDGSVTDDQIVQMLQTGPVVMAMQVNNYLKSYSEGIIYNNMDDYDPCYRGHAVAIVGYGSEDGVDYFTVKNSWSTYLGDRGYFRLERRGSSTRSSERFCNWGFILAQPTLSGAMPYNYDANHVVTSNQLLPAFIGEADNVDECCVTVYNQLHFGGDSQRFCGRVDWVGGEWMDAIASFKTEPGCYPWFHTDINTYGYAPGDWSNPGIYDGAVCCVFGITMERV